MQTQQIRSATQSITHTQSLTVVKTLLQAGLGAITYLRFFIFLFLVVCTNSFFPRRNLLPEDNFSSRSSPYHVSQLIADLELDHLNTVTSEDALLTKSSDNGFSQEASQTSNDSRKHANRFRIMVSFSLSFTIWLSNFAVHDTRIHGRSGQDSQLLGICVSFLQNPIY